MPSSFKRSYNLTDLDSKRINIIKFISIILVIFIHSYTIYVNFSNHRYNLHIPSYLSAYEEIISQIISSCGVPLFFLISSVLCFYKEHPFSGLLKKKFTSLIIPYLFWNSFWIVVWIVCQHLPFLEHFFSKTHINILDSTITEWFKLYGIGQQYPLAYPLWFIRDLFCMFLFYPILKIMLNISPKFCLVIGIICTFIPYDFFLKTAFSYFIIGGSIVKLDLHIDIIDKFSFYRLLFIYIIFIYISYMSKIFYLKNITTLIGILFILRLSLIIYKNIFLKFIFLSFSKYVFFIYVFHELTLTFIKKYA